MSAYAVLNPFIATSVGEKDLWNSASFLDVPGIHSGPFEVLRTAVNQIRIHHRSQVRFVRGAGGSGKSHLFARLHREFADGIFYAYAPNPPLQPEALENFILSRFVSSLRHPARNISGQDAPYSQLKLLAYALLKPVVEQDITLPELHDAWAEIEHETRKELIHQAVQLLEAEHPMVPRSVLRCLLNVLREDKEHLAAQWLSGAAYLTESELKYLNVPEPLARTEMGMVIQLFGKLASQAGAPVVLVLDQLDLISNPAQFDEIQRLLFTLIDQSENWVILIGLVAERFAAWDASLSQALRGRIGVPDVHAPLGFRLPVIDMLPVANEQKRQLLACRLESPALAEQRRNDGITSAIHPLLEEDVTRLTAGGAIFPRHLLAAAAEMYALRTAEARQSSPPIPAKASVAPVVLPQVVEKIKVASADSAQPVEPTPAKMPLSEKIDFLLQQAVDASKTETIPPSAIDLGERVRDLIELMVAPPVSMTEGDIRKSYDNFDGADRWFEWGRSKMRIVTSDSMRGSLIAVLERLKDSAGDTLLLRNYIAPVSGQLTMELLNAFKAQNIFHHMPPSESALLAALGRILAAQREGSYDQLATEPPATRENVLAALRNHPLLRGIKLWEIIQQVHAPKSAEILATPSVLATIARPPAIPTGKVAKPPPLPSAPMAKPIAKPPSPPVNKPPLGASRPPMGKLPPPSQSSNAA